MSDLESQTLLKQQKKQQKAPYIPSFLVGVVLAGIITCGILCFPSGDSTPSYNSIHDNFEDKGYYDFYIVADMEKNSKDADDKKGLWNSLLVKGRLKKNTNGRFSVEWFGETMLKSRISEAGRGMGLSSLLRFNGNLYTFDDETGLVYEILNEKAIPRYILMEGNGETTEAQKTEWATVKGGKMYVGSYGKERTNPNGSIQSLNPMWVSVIDSNGRITHENWEPYYTKLREAAGYRYPGYLMHEAIQWSSYLRKWVVLPRHESNKPYNEEENKIRGSNLILFASENFSKIQVKRIARKIASRGVSDFKFLPGSRDRVIVALKSKEDYITGAYNTYITVFTVDGAILMPETQLEQEYKFEGIEFVNSSVCFKQSKIYEFLSPLHPRQSQSLSPSQY